MPTRCVGDQLEVLSGISNYHWFSSVGEGGLRKSVNTRPRFQMMLLYNVESPDLQKPQFIPTSPRNQLMFFKMWTGYGERLYRSIIHFLSCDRGAPALHPNSSVAKKRKYTARVLRTTERDLLEAMSLESRDISVAGMGQFQTFAEDMASEGFLQMRLLSDEKVVVAMSDYSSSTGKLVPLKYVHVTAQISDSSSPLIKCTCSIYKMMQGAALQKVRVEEHEETFLSQDFTCMHCKFYKQYVHASRFEILNQNTSGPVVHKLQSSVDFINNPIVVLGEASSAVTTKLSVLSEGKCGVMHVYFTPHTCFARCQEGHCQSQLHRTRVPKRQSSDQATQAKMCAHMKVLHANLEVVHAIFPEFFSPVQDGEQEPLEPETDQDLPDPGDPGADVGEENLEDANLKVSLPLDFNVETGLWESNSVSQYKVSCDQFDSRLVKNSGKRLQFIKPQETLVGGVYKGPDLCKTVTDDNFECPCGSNFRNSEGQSLPPVLDHKTKIYTRMGVLLCNVFIQPCLGGTCFLTYDGEEDDIFFHSKVTGVAQEVFLDFQSQVMTSKCSFSAFCKERTRLYLTTNSASAPFLSRQTFVQVFFSNVAAMQLDFRKEIDPWCGYNPKVLAGDGTHVGVALKLQNLDPPITKPNIPQVQQTLHKKYDRCFLPYPKKLENETSADFNARLRSVKRARKYLKLVVQCADKGEPLPGVPEQLQLEKENFFEVVQTYAEPEVFDVLTLYVQRACDPELFQALTNLFLLFLTGDDSMSCVFPFRFHEHTLETCLLLQNGELDQFQQKLQEMRAYAAEVGQVLLHASRDNSPNCVHVIALFFSSLISSLHSVHAEDRPIPPAVPMEGTYNPPVTGTAYYFTPHGQQVRDLPHYSIQNEPKEILEQAACQKDFPQVPYGGFGYMFLYFCPHHGHSYGFHLIEGGEGRKDAFCPLFKFMEEPPEEIFYDFACQLHSYSLNREPEFFKKVRFWHDFFHSFSHKCGDSFKHKRVEGLETDTEICEQFNSFMQSVKFTGSHLSQQHFVLLVQYFICIWNKQKTQRFKAMAQVALAGLQ